jgi:hypothetical protein
MEVFVPRRRQGGQYGVLPVRAHRDKMAGLHDFRKTLARMAAPRRGPVEQVSEQRHRAGPPRRQTHHQTDEGIQGFAVRARHAVRDRDHAYYPQRADA